MNMGKKKKLINKTNVLQYAVAWFARCVFDDIWAGFAMPEEQADFARWLAEREPHKMKRPAATKVVAGLVHYLAFSFLDPLGLDSDRMNVPLGE